MAGLWIRLLAALALLSWATAAHAAWTVTRVSGHAAVVEVMPDGRATVEHTVELGVRGGPLQAFELDGVEGDFEALPGAQAVPVVRYGVPAPVPATLVRSKEGALRFELPRGRGLRTGSHVLRFRYTTNLAERGQLRLRGKRAVIEWVGPRFREGIDVARVSFRLPKGSAPPRLPALDDPEEASVLGGVYVSRVGEEDGRHVIELVRPHIARGEPAVWRVLADAALFPSLVEATPENAPASPRVLPLPEHPEARLAWVLVLLGVALGYGGLVLLKWRLFARDAQAADALPRAVLPLPIGVRAALAGALVASATALASDAEHPTLAAVLLLAGMIPAWILPARARVVPRGPGHWLPLRDEDAFRKVRTRFAGAPLDLGSRAGALVFAGTLGVLLAAAGLVHAASPYHGACLALGGVCLLPVFGTGRRVHLPPARAAIASARLPAFARALRGVGFRVVPFARIPEGGAAFDELRLMVRLTASRPGLSGIEIGLEHGMTAAGSLSLPFVLVRAREGSACHAALAPRVAFQRGRDGDERVAIVRPVLPTPAGIADLVLALARQLAEPASKGSRRSARNSSGTGSVTAKLRVASPAHAA